MKVTLIQPTVGRIGNRKMVRPWTLEPLNIAAIAGVTPPDIEVTFYDDRLEEIDYEAKTDLVGISAETLTALRSYEIAAHYRAKGIPVVIGGVHPTLVPQEVSKYADVVVSGSAEKIWPQILGDLKGGKLKEFYKETGSTINQVSVDKSVFGGRKYFPVSLVEFGRGCPFRCDFCDIPVYFDGRYDARPTEQLVSEIRNSRQSMFFVVDDNLGSRPQALYEFCKAITPLGIKWVSQTSITLARNEDLLDAVAKSGCWGVLIGFESLDAKNLTSMNKVFNTHIPFDVAIRRFHERGIRIYGSFIVGYDHDTRESIQRMVEFAIDQKIFIANFNPLTPIPGTPLYSRLKKEGRLINETWWLDYNYRYGDFVFQPATMSPEKMAQICEDAKSAFYSVNSIAKRGMRSRWNVSDFSSALGYLGANLMTRREVRLKGKSLLGFEKNLTDIVKKTP